MRAAFAGNGSFLVLVKSRLATDAFLLFTVKVGPDAAGDTDATHQHVSRAADRSQRRRFERLAGYGVELTFETDPQLPSVDDFAQRFQGSFHDALRVLSRAVGVAVASRLLLPGYDLELEVHRHDVHVGGFCDANELFSSGPAFDVDITDGAVGATAQSVVVCQRLVEVQLEVAFAAAPHAAAIGEEDEARLALQRRRRLLAGTRQQRHVTEVLLELRPRVVGFRSALERAFLSQVRGEVRSFLTLHTAVLSRAVLRALEPGVVRRLQRHALARSLAVLTVRLQHKPFATRAMETPVGVDAVVLAASVVDAALVDVPAVCAAVQLEALFAQTREGARRVDARLLADARGQTLVDIVARVVEVADLEALRTRALVASCGKSNRDSDFDRNRQADVSVLGFISCASDAFGVNVWWWNGATVHRTPEQETTQLENVVSHTLQKSSFSSEIRERCVGLCHVLCRVLVFSELGFRTFSTRSWLRSQIAEVCQLKEVKTRDRSFWETELTVVVDARVGAAGGASGALVHVEARPAVLVQREARRARALRARRRVRTLPVAAAVVDAARRDALPPVRVQHVLDVAAAHSAVSRVSALVLAPAVPHRAGCYATAFVGVEEVSRATGAGHGAAARGARVVLAVVLAAESLGAPGADGAVVAVLRQRVAGVAPAEVAAHGVDALVRAAAALREALVHVHAVVLVLHGAPEPFHALTAVLPRNVLAEVDAPSVLVLTFVLINTDFAVSIETLLTSAPVGLARVLTDGVLMAVVFAVLALVDLFPLQRDRGLAESGARPVAPGHDPVHTDVDVVVRAPVRRVLPAEREQELGLDELLLPVLAPFDLLVADLDTHLLALLHHVVNDLEEQPSVDGSVQVSREVVAVDPQLPVENLRFGHVGRRAVVTPISVTTGRVRDVEGPQPGPVVHQLEFGRCEGAGEVDADDGGGVAALGARRARRLQELDVAAVAAHDALAQVHLDEVVVGPRGGGATGGGRAREARPAQQQRDARAMEVHLTPQGSTHHRGSACCVLKKDE